MRLLITFMLQKDPVKRPSVWEIAKLPIINKNIRKYYEEEAPDDPFLKEYIFSGPKNKPNKPYPVTAKPENSKMETAK